MSTRVTSTRATSTRIQISCFRALSAVLVSFEFGVLICVVIDIIIEFIVFQSWKTENTVRMREKLLRLMGQLPSGLVEGHPRQQEDV